MPWIIYLSVFFIPYCYAFGENTMYGFHNPEQRQDLYEKIPSLFQKIDQDYEQWMSLDLETESVLKVEENFIKFLTSRQDLDVLWGELSAYDRLVHLKELRATHGQALEDLQKFSMKYLFDQDLYHSFEKATHVFEEHQKEYPRFSSCLDVLHRFLKSMREAGTHLSAEKKQELQEIQLGLSKLSQDFEQHILDAEEYVVFQWPESFLKGLSPDQKNLLSRDPQTQLYQINRTALCRELILRYVENRDLRKEYYHSCLTRCGSEDRLADKTNFEIAKSILELRLKKAQILGYESYQHKQLSNRLAQTPNQVNDFYKDFLKFLPKMAKQETESLEHYAQQRDSLSTSLENSDLGYYSRLEEESLLNLSEEQLKDYFSRDHVLSEFFRVFGDLYALSFDLLETPPDAFWNSDVFCVAVSDRTNHQLLGYIYFDLFQRPLKMSGAWMDELSVSTDYQDWRQPAHVLCIANFHEKDQWRCEEVQTLYHELGHSLHALLSRHPLAPCSGIGYVPWDIVELPSMLSEQWAKQPDFLKTLGRHKETGEALPEEWIDKIYAKERYGAARFLLRQVLLGFYDWTAHASDFDREQVLSLWRDLGQKNWPLGVSDRDCFPLTFSHIFAGGYSAGYYSYLWAEVYVHQVYKKMQELADHASWSEAGLAFRKAFLDRGSDEKLKEHLDQFLDAPLSVDDLLEYYGLRT